MIRVFSVSVLVAALFLADFSAPRTAAGANPQILELWPDKVPGETEELPAEKTLPQRESERPPVIRLTNVTRATLSFFPAPSAPQPRAVVMVCPGGGYNILAWNKEGTEVARWLNSQGVHAAVLKYRVPRRKDRDKHEAPLQDAQRALGLLRSKAGDLKINPKQIGVLGFSAGGHLSASLSTNWAERSYPSIDRADEVSCRPDFTVMVYPAYLQNDGELAAEIKVDDSTPPAFLVHAGDDRRSSRNSVSYYLALKAAGVDADLHIYGRGGHGFGMRPSQHPISAWPDRCADWLRSRGLAPGKSAP